MLTTQKTLTVDRIRFSAATLKRNRQGETKTGHWSLVKGLEIYWSQCGSGDLIVFNVGGISRNGSSFGDAIAILESNKYDDTLEPQDL